MRLALLSVLLPDLAAAGGFQRLHAAEGSATSYLKSNWNKYEENYHPNYVLDDDPKTAWVEGAEGDGLGESLTIPLSSIKSARALRLVIFNGYQKTKALLQANSAPRQLTVTVRDPSGRESARQQLTLEHRLGPQSFDIPVSGGVAQVVLTLDSAHAGTRYRDTCISDVQLLIDSDVPYSAAVEQGKRQALLRWKREQLETARYFANLPKSFPFAATRFESKTDSKQLSRRYSQVVDEDGDGFAEKGVPAKDFLPLQDQLRQGKVAAPFSEEDRALLEELDTLVRSGPPKAGRWYSLARAGRVVVPENFPLPAALSTLINLEEASLFEARGQGSLKPKMKLSSEDGYFEGEVLSNLLLVGGSAGEVKKVYFTYTHVIAERTATTDTLHGLALYEGGRLSRLVSLEKSEDEFNKRAAVGVLGAEYREGKLSRIELTRLVDFETVMEGPNPEDGISLERTTMEAVVGS